MDADEYYGEYLKGEDLKEDIEVTIKSVEPEEVGGKEKLVVSFNELKKSLVLNKTNKDRIKEQFNTAETMGWVGKKITLTTESAIFKGEEGPAIRVKKVTGTPAETMKPQSDFDEAVFGKKKEVPA